VRPRRCRLRQDTCRHHLSARTRNRRGHPPDYLPRPPAPLCFSRSCKRAAGLRARHDFCPLSNG
jgi:hypothetical protein